MLAAFATVKEAGEWSIKSLFTQLIFLVYTRRNFLELAGFTNTFSGAPYLLEKASSGQGGNFRR